MIVYSEKLRLNFIDIGLDFEIKTLIKI